MSKYFDGDKLSGYEDSPITYVYGSCEQCNNCGVGYNGLVFRPQGTILRDGDLSISGTSMSFTCDCCGREIFGCTFVNGMKFCAKCYQETFGNQKKYVDMLNKESSELLINLLAEKDKQIAELQKQLEEKDKDNQFLKKMYFLERTKNDNYHTEKYGLDKPVEELRKIKLKPKEKEIYYRGFDNCERQFATHIAELQQQLKTQPAEIVEKIKNELGFIINGKERIVCDGSMTGDKYIVSVLDTILKEYQK